MMLNPDQYISFARKYRPADFTHLIGQEVLVKTVSYAISHNRLSQGYILTGIRGVGKTTSARIIAKTINCTKLQKEEGKVKACDTCQNCIDFNIQRHPDIIEIDAASRTGVDDIREIIESSEYKPLLGRYKVFIIDEVHMLSKSAFNALLKLLEEPPAHVIFIFATTEIQKVPLTVISRCQRYDLRRLTSIELVLLLKEIAVKERIKYVDQALEIIACKADGSARDATSLFDQATSYCLNLNQEKIDVDLVNKMLGLIGNDVVIDFITLIFKAQTEQALKLVNDLYQNSINLEKFVELLSDFVAHLAKVKLIPNYTNSLYQSFQEKISAILTNIELPYLTILWQIFSKGVGEIKSSHNQLIAAEMLIVKAIHAIFINEITASKIVQNEVKKQEQIIDDKATNIIAEKQILKNSGAHINDLDKDNGAKTADIKNEKQIETNSSSEATMFLRYLDDSKERELYYFLFNETEIKELSQEQAILKLNCINPNTKIQQQLENILFTWTGKKWNVSISRSSEILTLREQLMNKAETSEQWKLIKQNFSDAKLSDVLLAQKN